MTGMPMMTPEDSLVDSLTAILRRADVRWNGCGDWYIAQAQAVIRELKLQPQEGDQFNVTKRRFITRWIDA